MVALAGSKGYQATSVADLVEVSGVSSRSFYQHFADKEECFLATMEVILTNLHRLLVSELEEDGNTEERAARTVLALIENLRAEPAATRVWLIEAFCAGKRAEGRINLAYDILATQLQKVYASLGKEEMPEELTRAIVRGAGGVVYNRFSSGREDDVAEIAKEVQAWALGFPVPPGPLRTKARRRRLPHTDAPAPFAAHIPGERVLRAFAELCAEKGYASTTISDIAARASISQTTLYTHFSGKEDVLKAALDSSGAQMVAATLPAIRRTSELPRAMRVAAEALCGFFAADPAFAHLREVEVFRVGPAAVRVRDRTGHELSVMLAQLTPGAPVEREGVKVEATLGAIHALLYSWIRSKGAETLSAAVPLVTYLALAPWLGGEAAWEAACG
ncbi:MAG TPA: TetR/AcrR family transcriptional regulator [Solirubrobacterales bacterium]|nr:TetR/AcrR family transcriptional regulator [Solirubrobacterales bacterium]